jgi:TRAP transporter TAXI family solute receptor
MKRGRYYAILTITLGLFLIFLVAVTIYTSKRRVPLDFTSGQEPGTYLHLARSIASLVDERIDITVHKSDGSRENARRISKGEAQLGLIQNDTQTHGDDSLRALVPLHLGALHFLARKESGIESLADLEGHRVGTGLETSGSYQVVNELFNHFELDLDKITLVRGDIETACNNLATGETEALLIMLSLKSPVLNDLLDSGDIKLVEIGKDSGKGSVIDGFRLSYPFVEPYLIPRFAYTAPHGDNPGVPDKPIPTLAVHTVLVAHKDMPLSVAREITRTVIENRNTLIREHLGASMFEDNLSIDQLQFPLHDGASAYYRRHEPGFLVRYAEVIALILSLFITIYGLLMASKRWFIQRQKDRIDAYYLQLNGLLTQVSHADSNQDLQVIESELQEIRSSALQLLARERLIPDESFRIFQSLLSEAAQEIRHKRLAYNLSDSSTA